LPAVEQAASPTPTSDLLFDRLLASGVGEDDPYPAYRALADFGPVQQLRSGTWLVLGYDDCASVLRDPRYVNDVERVCTDKGGPSWGDHPSLRMLSEMLLMANPPRHRRLRRFVAATFARARIEALRGEIGRIVDELLDRIEDAGTTDFVAEFSDVLPIRVVHLVLGIPGTGEDEAGRDLRHHTLAFNALFERSMSPERLEAADRAVLGLRAYIGELIDGTSREPAGDLLSSLVAAHRAGLLDVDDVVMLLFQVYNASFQTTTSLLGNGLHAFLHHPDQLELLRRDRAAVPAAVQECLRFDPPVQTTGRHADRDVVLHGAGIAQGDMVVTILAAANRDPRWFPDPDRFLVARSGPPPLSYGAGPHYCLGAGLATLQAEVAFAALVRRFRVLEPAGAPRRRPTANMRGFASLPLSVAAG
jgi:cytochrome P450